MSPAAHPGDTAESAGVFPLPPDQLLPLLLLLLPLLRLPRLLLLVVCVVCRLKGR